MNNKFDKLPNIIDDSVNVYTLVEMNSSITLMVTILSRRYYDNKSIIFKNEHVLALEVTVSEWYKYVHE